LVDARFCGDGVRCRPTNHLPLNEKKEKMGWDGARPSLHGTKNSKSGTIPINPAMRELCTRLLEDRREPRECCMPIATGEWEPVGCREVSPLSDDSIPSISDMIAGLK
jgi:hypothetical protein